MASNILSTVLPQGVPNAAASAHQDAWNAALNAAPTTTVHGATISSPAISLEPPLQVKQQTNFVVPTPSATTVLRGTALGTTVPPKDGFLLTGKLDLFGLGKLTADFYSYHGSIPSDVVLPNGIAPIYQMATLNEDLRMSTIVPSLAGSTFDAIALQNVVFTYQNCVIDTTRAEGFYIDADIVFDESYGKVHQALSTVLGIAEPKLHLQATLGEVQAWNQPLQVSSFILIGSFPDIVLKPCPDLTLTSIGVELFGYNTLKYAVDGTAKVGMDYGFGIFGTLQLELLHSVELDWEIRDGGSDLEFSADMLTDWENALGISGLILEGVSLYTTIGIKNPLQSFSCTVEAMLNAGSTVAALSGSYSSGGNFSVTASFLNLGTSGISDFFDSLHADTLAVPKIAVNIGAATLTIGSGGVFTLQVQDLSVEHYNGANGEVDITSSGVIIKASITNDGSGTPSAPGEKTLHFGDVDIEKAYIQISLAPSSSGKSSDVILGGELKWQSFELEAGVHVYPSTNGKGGLEWTVFAEFVKATPDSQGLALSHLLPELGGSFLGDITLEAAALIAASQDDPEFGAFNPGGYPVSQGVQVCAILGVIKAFADLLRTSTPPRLTLSAGWSKVSGFSLDILLPTPMTLNLGRGITTDPFSLQIRTVSTTPSIPPPILRLNAGVKIPVPNNTTPLHFTLALDFSGIEGVVTGELAGYWTDPFGISPKLTIGPVVALTIGIQIETFTVSPFGFVGGLQIGDVMASVAMEISEIPTQELLSAEVKNFHITDVVLLARDITQLPIPMVPDFMIFNDIKLYICPTGTTIANVVYQRGFQFIADMLIFGKQADVSVVVDGKSITASASLDNLYLGPLHITGITGPKATANLELSISKQAGSFNGKMSLFDYEEELDLQFEFRPDPYFSFTFLLEFTPHLVFKVNADMIGTITNVHDISNIDFHLVATMQQDILDYVAQQINQQFSQATKAEQGDINAEKAKVAAAKQVVDANIQAQQAKVDGDYAAWKAKSDAVNANFNSVTNAYNAKVKELQDQVDAATAKYKNDFAAAQHQVSLANADRGAKLQAARAQVAQARGDWAAKINNASRSLDNATRNMNAQFADAKGKIDGAQAKVNDIQSKINDINGKIHHLEHLHGIAAIGKAGLGALYAGRVTLEGSMRAAEGVLTLAKAAVESQQYVAAQGIMKAAQGTLTTTQAAGQKAIAAAEQTLTATDRATQLAVDAAGQTLTGVEKTGPAAIDVATKSLDAYKAASVATLEAAKSSVDGLSKSGEYVAWQASLKGLAAAKSSTHELDLSTAALDTAEKGGKGLLDAADYVATHALTFVDIHYIRLEGEFGKAAQGAEFAAAVQGSVAGKSFAFDMTYDPRKTVDFINNLFHRLLDEVKTGIKV